MSFAIFPKPILSIIVVVYNMPSQAQKTLKSLSAEYQKGVNEKDYEIVVMENVSDNLLGETKVCLQGNNFRYVLRRDDTASPVFALNEGVRKAKGRMLAMMIDGARMVTPGVVANTLLAEDMARQPLVSAPGYHIGEQLHQKAVEEGYDESVESDLLRSINWPEDGYRLFDIACLSGTSAGGFFKPIAESNFLALSKRLYFDLGGFDTRFDFPGGGFANLDMYKRACEHNRTTLFMLPGEGTFHQFHGGVTTGQDHGRLQKDILPKLSGQYKEIRGDYYKPPQKRPIFLGMIPDNAQRFIKFSSERILEHYAG